MKRVATLAFVAALGLAAALSSSGCSSCGAGTSGQKATRQDISLMPRETNFVVMANVARMRGTPLWNRMLALRDESPEQKAKYDDFVKKTGLDPLQHVDSIFAGFPTTKGSGEFGAILRGGPFDEAKLVAYMKEQAQKDGGDFTSTDYNGKKLYSDKSGQTYGAFLDGPNGRTLALGGREWIKKIVDLSAKSDGDSAAKNDALTALIKKTRTGDALWGAGIVPDDARQALKDDPRLTDAATMKDAYASLDLQGGFSLAGAVDLAGEPEAKTLSARVNDQLADAKRNPQVQMMGLTQFLDAIKATSQAATFHLDVKLTQTQVDDLIARLQGLFKTFGGALGGGAGMGAPSAPPAMEPPPAMPGPGPGTAPPSKP